MHKENEPCLDHKIFKFSHSLLTNKDVINRKLEKSGKSIFELRSKNWLLQKIVCGIEGKKLHHEITEIQSFLMTP